MSISDRRKLRELVSAMCDRTLTSEEYDTLDKLLLSSDETVEYAVRLLEINADLSHQASGLLNSSCCDDPVELGQSSVNGVAVRTGFATRSSAVSWPVFVAAAALVAVVTAVTTWGVLDRESHLANTNPSGLLSSQPETESENLLGETFVARIVRKIDCDLEDDRWRLRSELNILPDQTLSMRQGLLELEFASGARVTLEGPATFTAVTPMSAVLLHGQLTANVPKQARGFKVETPGGQTIDLGTRFGLSVDDRGETETHVFEGEVLVRDNMKEEGVPEEIHLTENMAYKFASASSPSRSLPAEPERFVQLGFAGHGEAAPQNPPVVMKDLSLWLTADAQVQVDKSSHVSGWGNAMPSSDQQIVAWQVRSRNRPLLKEGVFGERPGLHFNGRSYLVTDPLKMQGNSSFGIVFQFDAKKMTRRRTTWPQGYQLLNCNGPATMVMRLNKKLHMSAFMYAGVTVKESGAEQHIKSGVTWSDALAEKTPHVAVYVNDVVHGSARLYIDGTMVGESPCTVSKATKVPRFIGSHNHMTHPRFVGHMAELMFYNQALTNEDALVLSKSLMEKYSVVSE